MALDQISLDQVLPQQALPEKNTATPVFGEEKKSSNLIHRISDLTILMREMSLLERTLAQTEFKNCQKAIKSAVEQEASALKSQAGVHLTTAFIRTIFLTVSIAGAAFKAAETAAPVGGNTGVLQIERMAQTRWGEFLNKALQQTKRAILKLPHEKMPDLANALGEVAIFPEKRLQAKMTQANAEAKKEDKLSEDAKHNQNLIRQTIEEIAQAYRSLATAEAQSRSSR